MPLISSEGEVVRVRIDAPATSAANCQVVRMPLRNPSEVTATPGITFRRGVPSVRRRWMAKSTARNGARGLRESMKRRTVNRAVMPVEKMKALIKIAL